MRITGGTVGGRKLVTPKDSTTTRPTSDRVREALFSILSRHIKDSIVLDLFAGTGALGIEALSRGARFALFADQSKDAARLIHTNLLACFKKPQAGFAQLNLTNPKAFSKLKHHLPDQAPCDLIFMDPPYRKDCVPPVLQQIRATKLLASKGPIVVEEHRQVNLPETIAGFQVIDQRTYGETGIWIYIDSA